MWFKTSLLITCLIVESCSMNFMNFSEMGGRRGPAAIVDFTPIINKMKNFKVKVLGSEVDVNCSKAQLDANFNRLMASVKRDSCSVDNYTLDRAEIDQKACPKRKIEGYFDRVVRATINEEKSKKPLTYFQNKLDPQFMALLKEATIHFKETEKTYNEAYDRGSRAELLAAYVENVLLPLRDIIVIKRSYLPKENDGRNLYLNLQPYLTPNFVKGLDQSQLGLITQGPNPGSSPFYMEITRVPNSKVLRLTFIPTDIIRHDVLTLLKAPSAKNYVIALKWMTLHMMLSQVYLYNTILGTNAPIAIPTTCQNQFNGNLPSTFKFNFEPGAGEQFLDNILASHGLTYKEDDSSYLDYYIDNVNKDPTKDGYSGLVPFENYKNALRSTASASFAVEPQFDDVAHFQSVMSYKSGEAQAAFRGKVGKQIVTYAGSETFQKILGEFPADDVAEVKLKSGEMKQIYPGKQNLSPYVLELMQQNGFVDYSSLITSNMKKKFVGKRSVIEFPSMYSSPIWRDWSLRLLADKLFAQRNTPANSSLGSLMRTACMVNPRKSPELLKICTGNPVLNLANFLGEFRSGDKYVPTRRLEESKFQGVYPYMGYIWNNMRDSFGMLPEATPYELNFLIDQLAAGNPWARLRFGYMVALDQLEYQRAGILPQYDTKNYSSKTNYQVMCKISNVTVQYNALLKAGKVLGLNKTLSYNHAGRLLSYKEKAQVWKGIVDDIQQRNAQLFSVKSKAGTYYNTAENVSYKTLLSEGAALNSGAAISQRAKNEIKQVSQKTEAKLGNFFLALYNLRDPVKQQELYEKFSAVNGIDNTFSLKLNFLALDDSYKKPIYKDLLRQAAFARKNQVLGQLGNFCKMDVNDAVQFKTIFYAASKAQNDLNQMAGLPAVPNQVMSKINEMTPSEWRDMWWGIGSGVAGVAAVIVGGACTALSGGICAPLGGAMAIAGLASLGIQVKLTANEYDRKKVADSNEKQIKIMEELGFANTGSADEVHRSYAWTAFEAISIFPLIGVATRSLKLGPKLVYVSARSIMRQTGKAAFRSAAKSVTQEEDVRAAYYLLGMTTTAKDAGLNARTLQAATLQITKIKKLYTSGAIGMEEMMKRIGIVLAPIKRAKAAMAKVAKGAIGKITIKESKEQIDRQTAQVISSYFGDNPKEMLRIMSGYSGERLNKSVRIMAEINAKDRIARRIPIYGGVRDWAMRMRNESLAKNASKILRIEKELSGMGSNPGQLTNYINKNIEDLTEIFIEIPFKKREIPYFVFVQGMPEFNFFKGRRIPLISMMSDGQTLRRIVTARARLVHEAYKTQARAALKLTKFVQSETTYGAFKAFQGSVAELANRKTGQEAGKVMASYRRVEEVMTRKLYVKYSAKGQKMEYAAFKNLIMNPATAKEKAMAEVIWESVPGGDLLGTKEVGEFAHQAAMELSKYNDVDSFERYLGALKVLTINKNPAVLEIM